MAPRRPRRRRLGLRPDASRPPGQAGSGPGGRGAARASGSSPAPLAIDHGGGVQLQRRGHHRRLPRGPPARSEEHTSELQSRENIVCRLLLEKKKKNKYIPPRLKNKKKT